MSSTKPINFDQPPLAFEPVTVEAHCRVPLPSDILDLVLNDERRLIWQFDTVNECIAISNKRTDIDRFRCQTKPTKVYEQGDDNDIYKIRPSSDYSEKIGDRLNHGMRVVYVVYPSQIEGDIKSAYLMLPEDMDKLKLQLKPDPDSDQNLDQLSTPRLMY